MRFDFSSLSSKIPMPFRLHDKPQQPENSHEDELFADAKIVTPLLKNVAHDFLTFGERVLNYNSPKDKSWLRTQFSDKILKPSMYRQGPPKTRLRARQKAADKGWEHLSDLARGCIEVSNKNQLAVLISLFKCAKTNPDLCYLPHDAEVISIKDKYTTPYKENKSIENQTGYRDCLISIAVPIPNSQRWHICELALRHKNFVERADKLTHTPYETYRLVDEKLERMKKDKSAWSYKQKGHYKTLKARLVASAQKCREIHDRIATEEDLGQLFCRTQTINTPSGQEVFEKIGLIEKYSQQITEFILKRNLEKNQPEVKDTANVEEPHVTPTLP